MSTRLLTSRKCRQRELRFDNLPETNLRAYQVPRSYLTRIRHCAADMTRAISKANDCDTKSVDKTCDLPPSLLSNSATRRNPFDAIALSLRGYIAGEQRKCTRSSYKIWILAISSRGDARAIKRGRPASVRADFIPRGRVKGGRGAR